MALKRYRCNQFPRLTIAGVCEFTNNEFTTNSLTVQSKIEQSQSFRAGIVRLDEIDEDEPISTESITPTDVTRMKKVQLVELAEAMGIEFGSDATRPDLVSLICAEMRRE